MTRTGGLGAVAAILLTVVVAIGLLYAYRAQSPAIQTITYTAALAALQEGRLRSVTIDGSRATLAFVDGTRRQTTIPDDGRAFTQAIADHNRADPVRLVDVQLGTEIASVPLPFFLIPLLLLFVLVVLVAWAFGRARAPDRYVALSRLADLRERGVLSEEEFQREKRRILA